MVATMRIGPGPVARQVAAQLVAKLQNGSSMAVMQSGNTTDMVQPWTTDKDAVLKTLKNKLISTRRSRISEAMASASEQLKDRPEGARHVVMITDGVDTPGAKIKREDAMKQLIAARATVHVISYTEFVRQKQEKKSSPVVSSQRPNSSDPIRATDPTQPPGATRSPSSCRRAASAAAGRASCGRTSAAACR